MKIRFAILFVILCVAGVFLCLEKELTPAYQNEAFFAGEWRLRKTSLSH